MNVFDLLSLIGGICLFLFGMNVMGGALERRAGGKLKTLLGRMTTGKTAGLLTGLGITALIQSSSATTVMVVGFVNSGLMTLRQAINVIMGANIGTTVTAWILSLAGIDSANVFVKLLKPSSFTPVLALIGIILYMAAKSSKKKDTGVILLGFATLMFGMEAMSGAVSGLRNVPEFTNLFLLFKNPILGVLAGALLTAIIQSSSASVGILQALSAAGGVSYSAAIPIIMGQNIGTCVTAMISSIGANKNAKRAALVHLTFNVIGTLICLTVFVLVRLIFAPAFFDTPASLFGIAVAHSAFNVFCTLIMLPFTGALEKIVCKIARDGKQKDDTPELDERLLMTPSIALDRANTVAVEMAEVSFGAMREATLLFKEFSEEKAKEVRKAEEKADRYEDILGTYLVRLSTKQISKEDSLSAAKLLKIIGDFERISDHAVNIVESADELKSKGLTLSSGAKNELDVFTKATNEIMTVTLESFITDDKELAKSVEPLKEVIHEIKERLRMNHVTRLQSETCSIEVGFVWSDLLSNLERVADHCSNIAASVINTDRESLLIHKELREERDNSDSFAARYKEYYEKYSLS